MKKSGFTIIETILSILLLSGFGLLSFDLLKKETLFEKYNHKEDIPSLLEGIDKRISIDGYKSSLWTKNQWSNNNFDDLLKKELIAKNIKCKGIYGNWTPKNGDNNIITVKCDIFRNDNVINKEAEIIKDGNGYIKEFIIDYKIKDKYRTIENMVEFKKIFDESKSNTKQLKTGIVNFQYKDKTTKRNISGNKCLKNINECLFRTSLIRQGGDEYLKIDGSNSIVNANISYIKTTDDSPLKCIKWTKENGSWDKVIDANCGIGIDKENKIKEVDVLVENGMFENILLNRSCNLYEWINNNIVLSSKKSPCGFSNDGLNIIQVVDNIQSEKGFLKKLYVDELNVYNAFFDLIELKNIVAEKITSRTIIVNDVLKNKNNLIILANVKMKEKSKFKIKKIDLNNINLNIKTNLKNNDKMIGKNIKAQNGTSIFYNAKIKRLNGLDNRSVVMLKKAHASVKMEGIDGQFININEELNNLDVRIENINNKINELKK